MTTAKIYAVFLADGADDELGKGFSTFVQTRDGDVYISAKSIDPEGNYFRMTVDHEVPTKEKVELELQIHHEFVKGVFCGTETDLKQLGIT
jgi:hypothetical protein